MHDRWMRALTATALTIAVMLDPLAPGATGTTGATLAARSSAASGSTSGAVLVPFATWSQVTGHLYQAILGRAPTPSESALGVGDLAAGATTAGELAASLLARDEHASVVDPGVRLYQAAFLRAPDRSGFTYWIDRRRAGTWTLVRMAEHFGRSSEFQRRYGNLSDAAYVDQIYRNVLGRAPDAAGRAFWVGRLQRRVTTRGHLLASFSESSEHRRTTATPTTVHLVFLHLLGRPATAEELRAIAQAGGSATAAASLAQQVLVDLEHIRRVDPATDGPVLLTVRADGTTAIGGAHLLASTPDGTQLLIGADPSRVGFGEGLYVWQRFVGIRAVPIGPAPTGAPRAIWAADLSDDGSVLVVLRADLGDVGSGGSLWRIDRDLDVATELPLPAGSRRPDLSPVGSIDGTGDLIAYSVILDDHHQVHAYDHRDASTRLVSAGTDGQPGDGDSGFATISGDGSTIAFTSVANLDGATPAPQGLRHTWAWDRTSGTVERASVDAGETGTSIFAWTSDDGRRVGYLTPEALDPADDDDLPDLYIADRTTGSITLAARDEAQGRPVVVSSAAVSDDARVTVVQRTFDDGWTGTGGVWLHDVVSGERRLVWDDAPSLGGGFMRIDRTNRRVAFSTPIPFAPGDAPAGDGEEDVYLLALPALG